MHTIIHGDCLEELKKLEDNSVDAVITDPPYGLSNTKPKQVADVLKAWVTGDTVSVPAKRGGFMGKDWDSFVPPPAVWEECMRVLKPGGHMAVFAGARTQDLMGLSIRLAGFEIRDTLGWIHSQGFPKGQDLGKIIDKKLGAERTEVAGRGWHIGTGGGSGVTIGHFAEKYKKGDATVGRKLLAPATSEAKQWAGWSSQLKPAIEPIILARKPLVGTVANNVLAHGVGGLNIDACRVPHAGEKLLGGASTVGMRPGDMHEGWSRPFHSDDKARERGRVQSAANAAKSESLGRFPANVLLDEHAAKEMDEQSGNRPGFATQTDLQDGKPGGSFLGTRRDATRAGEVRQGYNDSGGASRFFPVFKYQAKAPKKERPVIEREDGTKIQHPTVKPLKLMEWLVTLITPEGGTVLDPFAGTGTTLQAATNKGFRPIGIEADADYIQLIHQRLEGGGQSTRSS